MIFPCCSGLKGAHCKELARAKQTHKRQPENGAGRFGFAMRAAYALKFWFYAQADAGNLDAIVVNIQIQAAKAA